MGARLFLILVLLSSLSTALPSRAEGPTPSADEVPFPGTFDPRTGKVDLPAVRAAYKFQLATVGEATLGPGSNRVAVGIALGYGDPKARTRPALLVSQNRVGIGVARMIPKLDVLVDVGIGIGYVRDFADNEWRPVVYGCVYSW